MTSPPATPAADHPAGPGGTAEFARLSWRELVELLRRQGLPRSRRDTKRTLVARLAAALSAAEPPPPGRVRLRQVLLVEGAPEALQELGRHLRPAHAEFLSSGLLALAPSRRAAATLAARRASLGLAEAPEVYARAGQGRIPAGLLAAGLLVRELAALLGWPRASLGADLLRLEAGEDGPPFSPAHPLLRCWRGLLDASLPHDAAAPPPATSPTPPPDDSVRQVLLLALQGGRCVELRYEGAARGLPTCRTVEPLALHDFRGREYLHAYCHWRQARRLFRLDRITACRLLADAQNPPRPAGESNPPTRNSKLETRN